MGRGTRSNGRRLRLVDDPVTVPALLPEQEDRSDEKSQCDQPDAHRPEAGHQPPARRQQVPVAPEEERSHDEIHGAESDYSNLRSDLPV